MGGIFFYKNNEQKINQTSSYVSNEDTLPVIGKELTDPDYDVSSAEETAMYHLKIINGIGKGKIKGFSCDIDDPNGLSFFATDPRENENNEIIVSNAKNGSILTIELTTDGGDVVTQDFVVNINYVEPIIEDPQNIIHTNDGATFEVNIIDGFAEGIITSIDLTTDNGVVEPAEGDNLVVGNNSIVLSGLTDGEEASITIVARVKPNTELGKDIEKTFIIKRGKLAIIEDPQSMVWTNDGVKFDIDIKNGIDAGSVSKADLELDNELGTVTVLGDSLIIGTNHITVSGLNPGDKAIVTITLHSEMEDVKKDINIEVNKESEIEDPQNVTLTEDGATFNIDIIDGVAQGKVDSSEMTVNKGSIEVTGGGDLEIGTNNITLSGLKNVDQTMVTIILHSKLGDVEKDFPIIFGVSAIIDDAQHMTPTSDGAKFDINITDGVDKGAVTSYDISIADGHPGNVEVESHDHSLHEGNNTIVTTELNMHETNTVVITLNSGLNDVVKNVEIPPRTFPKTNVENISKESKGATFSINIEDAPESDKEFIGIESADMSVDNGTAKVKDGSDLKIGNNDIVVTGLKHGKKANVSIILHIKNGETITTNIEVQASNVVFIVILSSSIILILIIIAISIAAFIFIQNKHKQEIIETRKNFRGNNWG